MCLASNSECFLPCSAERVSAQACAQVVGEPAHVADTQTDMHRISYLLSTDANQHKKMHTTHNPKTAHDAKKWGRSVAEGSADAVAACVAATSV